MEHIKHALSSMTCSDVSLQAVRDVVEGSHKETHHVTSAVFQLAFHLIFFSSNIAGQWLVTGDHLEPFAKLLHLLCKWLSPDV